MRIIFILLTIIAALLTILVIGLTIILIANGGGISIVLPGLGLIVSLSFILVLLAAIDAFNFSRLAFQTNEQAAENSLTFN